MTKGDEVHTWVFTRGRLGVEASFETLLGLVGQFEEESWARLCLSLDHAVGLLCRCVLMRADNTAIASSDQSRMLDVRFAWEIRQDISGGSFRL